MKIINYEIKLKNKSFGNYETRKEMTNKLQEIKNSEHQNGIYKIYYTKENGIRDEFFSILL